MKFCQGIFTVYKYYNAVTYSLLDLQNIHYKQTNHFNSFKLLGTVPWPKLTLNLITHTYAASIAIHNSLLYLGFYSEKFGTLDVFSKLENSQWVLCFTLFFLCTYPIMLNGSFIVKLEKLVQVLENSWVSISSRIPKTQVAKLKQSMNRNWKSLFYHNCLMDLYEGPFYAYSMWGAVSYRTIPYSVFPWQNIGTDTIAWFIQSLTLTTAALSWSFIHSFPGTISYHVAGVIQGMTKGILQEGKQTTSAYMKTLHDYKCLQLATRLLSDYIAKLLLVVLLIWGVEQTIVCYTMFQIIKSGETSADLMFLVTDLAV